jgi:AraC family transcriptional regulator
MHPELLTRALDETAGRDELELTEHWNLDDPQIAAVLRAMMLDLEAGMPAGRLYGDSLANVLAVYLLNRYTVRRVKPIKHRRGLARHRLRRVLDHIDGHLAEDLSLSQLSSVVDMSEHYFVELFKTSTGSSPHQYVLQRRIDRAKQLLLDRHAKYSVIETGLETGFRNPSHFACVFRRLVGVSPSQFRTRSRGS